MPVRQGVRSPYLTALRPSTQSSPANRSAKATTRATMTTTALIDNSHNIYWRVRFRSCGGLIVMCRPQVFWRCPKVLQVLYADVCEILKLLPKAVHPLIQRTKIFVNHEYAYGLKAKPVVVQHMTAHHHHEWLLWARDRVDKALSIEIYNAADFCRMRQHWNGCGLLLHEYCHIIHQHVLGLRNQRVIDLYQDARRSKRYEKVLRRDYAGKDVDHDLHYAMVDQKEFFAEMSVTFWSRGYQDLDQPADATRMDLCSPPIIEPNVKRRLETQTGTSARLLGPIDSREGHCNKFQPFTAGQLKHHDSELYQRMAALWETIAEWKDSEQKMTCCEKSCWAPLRVPSKTKTLVATGDTVSL